MPYKIEKVGKGYKVCDTEKCFSKKPLPLKTARAQRVAIAMSEHAKTGKPMKKFFM